MHVVKRDLSDLIQIVFKRFWLIIIITAVITVSTGLVSFFVLPPTYEATSEVLLNLDGKSSQNNQDGAASFYQLETSFKLLDTFIVISESPQVIDKVINNLDIKENYSQLKQKIKVSQVHNSLVISISAKDGNPKRASEIANEMSSVLVKEIDQNFGKSNVTMLKQAQISELASPVQPKPLLNIVVALIAGFILSIGIVYVIELFKEALNRRNRKSDHLSERSTRLKNLPGN